MYLPNCEQEHFLAAGLVVCMNRDLNVQVLAQLQISCQVQSFQDKAETASDAVFSFHSQEVTKKNR